MQIVSQHWYSGREAEVNNPILLRRNSPFSGWTNSRQSTLFWENKDLAQLLLGDLCCVLSIPIPRLLIKVGNCGFPARKFDQLLNPPSAAPPVVGLQRLPRLISCFSLLAPRQVDISKEDLNLLALCLKEPFKTTNFISFLFVAQVVSVWGLKCQKRLSCNILDCLALSNSLLIKKDKKRQKKKVL